MSELYVPVTTITAIRPHPNANKLELAEIEGYQCCVPIGIYRPGDVVTYIPPGLILPKDLSDKIGVTSYLSNSGRVKSIRLRGEFSHGVIAACNLVADATIGTNVAEQLGITKPPEPEEARWHQKFGKTPSAPVHPLFYNYTDMENMRKYRNIFHDDEEVCILEKVNGTRSRLGIINGQLMAASKNVGRKVPIEPNKWYDTILKFFDKMPFRFDYNAAHQNWYWYPYCLESIRNFLQYQQKIGINTILYGETFGGPVQKMGYGYESLSYRVFDISIDGRYLNRLEFLNFCDKWHLPHVPCLYTGKFSLEKVKELASGKTLINNASHIREGVVVKPLIERHDPKIGRVILKYISDEYLAGNYEE